MGGGRSSYGPEHTAASSMESTTKSMESTTESMESTTAVDLQDALQRGFTQLDRQLDGLTTFVCPPGPEMLLSMPCGDGQGLVWHVQITECFPCSIGVVSDNAAGMDKASVYNGNKSQTWLHSDRGTPEEYKKQLEDDDVLGQSRRVLPGLMQRWVTVRYDPVRGQTTFDVQQSNPCFSSDQGSVVLQGPTRCPEGGPVRLAVCAFSGCVISLVSFQYLAPCLFLSGFLPAPCFMPYGCQLISHIGCRCPPPHHPVLRKW